MNVKTSIDWRRLVNIGAFLKIGSVYVVCRERITNLGRRELIYVNSAVNRLLHTIAAFPNTACRVSRKHMKKAYAHTRNIMRGELLNNEYIR